MVFLAFLSACVPKGRHELTEVQLDATRTALSARAAQCAADGQACEATVAALEAEISARQAQLDELARREALRDAEIVRLEALRVGLAAELEALAAELAKKGKAPPPQPAETVGGRAVADIAAAVGEHLRETIERERHAAARAETEAAFAALVAEGRAELATRGEAVVVRFPTALLFQEGFTTLSPRGEQVAQAAAEALSRLPGRTVTVEGHTDDAPVHTAEWPSNWERGFSRAVAVLRALEAAGAGTRLSAASFAATRPLGPDARQNDRVELVVALDPELPTAFAPTPEPSP